jgi:CubicO group peptidase (beta-lactamase class C family)
MLRILGLTLLSMTQAQQPWLQYAVPAEAGFSAAKLEAARQYADSVGSAAVMVVYRGHVLAAWGDVARKLQAHSVRKSLLSALYGIAAAEGKIDLDATLAELGVDDAPQPLTAQEKQAKVRHLIAARSGVYLPAAYAPSEQDDTRPARGSHLPGTNWFYNNWDFNVAGVVYERLTGEDVFAAFERRIARVISMEDFDPADGFDVYEPSRSMHPAHTFRISARDLARFGQLYLQEGRWSGRQVVPREWIRESIRPHSDLGAGRGYGYMWWTYATGSLSDEHYPHADRYDTYVALGSGGQAVFVVRGAELVLVHRGDTDNHRPVAGREAWAILERVLDARSGKPAARPAVGPVVPTPLASQLPPRPRLTFVAVDSGALVAYVGDYELSAGRVARVFPWRGRPFISMPGEGEAELFALSATEFAIRVAPGVRVVFERDGTGRVTGMMVSNGSTTARARKLG